MTQYTKPESLIVGMAYWLKIHPRRDSDRAVMAMVELHVLRFDHVAEVSLIASDQTMFTVENHELMIRHVR